MSDITPDNVLAHVRRANVGTAEEVLFKALDRLCEEGWDCPPDLVSRLAQELGLPKYTVCDRCGGEGYVSKLGAFGRDWLDEQFGGDSEAEAEFLEEYMRPGGVYDERCPECKGQRVVTWDRVWMSEEDARYLAEVEQERRMGA